MILAEDLAVGQIYHIGAYPITESGIIGFASEWDPHPIHCDPIAARASSCNGLIASGIHTLAVFQRLAATSIYSSWEVIAGRRIKDIEFPRPVRGGMVLHGQATVLDNQPCAQERSLVTIAGRLEAEGRTMLTLRVEMYVRRGPV